MSEPINCSTTVCFVCVQSTASRVAVQESQIKSPLEKHHADAVVNFLLRIACQVKLSFILQYTPHMISRKK